LQQWLKESSSPPWKIKQHHTETHFVIPEEVVLYLVALNFFKPCSGHKNIAQFEALAPHIIRYAAD
jgi:hypothetical protein